MPLAARMQSPLDDTNCEPNGVTEMMTEKHRSVFCVTVLLLSSCGGEKIRQESVSTQQQPIVGGSEAWLDSAVAVKTTQCTFSGNFPAACTALLISPTAVVTAKHCVSHFPTTTCPNGIDPNKTSTFSVAVGCHDIVNSCPADHWIGLAAAPVLAPGTDDDVAVLHLVRSVTAKPTRLASPARLAEIKAADSVTMYGWGHTTENGTGSPILMSVARPIESIPFNVPGFDPKAYAFSTTCGLNPYVGTDSGDSGGPTLVLRDGEWFTLGVIQEGAYGSMRNLHGLVPYYFDWLLQQATDAPAQSLLPSAQISAVASVLG
jgi:hypothetical protein